MNRIGAILYPKRSDENIFDIIEIFNDSHFKNYSIKTHENRITLKSDNLTFKIFDTGIVEIASWGHCALSKLNELMELIGHLKNKGTVFAEIYAYLNHNYQFKNAEIFIYDFKKLAFQLNLNEHQIKDLKNSTSFSAISREIIWA